MTDSAHTQRQLTVITWLLAFNLLAMIVGAGAIVLGLLPKLERAVQSTERVETRFQRFADQVEPVLTVGAGKAVDALQGMDTRKLSEAATEKAGSMIDAAGERARRFLEGDKPKAE